MSIHRTIAERIRWLRCQYDESPSAFAFTAGVRPDTILRIERQTHKTPTSKLIEIAYNLGVSMSFLIDPNGMIDGTYNDGLEVAPAVMKTRIGRNLQRLRTAVSPSLSQVGLGRLAGVHPNKVSAYELGDSIPVLETLEKLAIALNVPPSAFFAPPERSRHDR